MAEQVALRANQLVNHLEARLGDLLRHVGPMCPCEPHPASEPAPRFATQIAALDQDHTATAAYAKSVSELERWPSDYSNSDRGSELRAAPG